MSLDPLRTPLQVIGGHFATVPRDSDEDVAQSLLAISRHRPGTRWDHPTMGIEPQDYVEEQEIDADAIAAQVAEHDGRVTLGGRLITDALGTAADELRLEWRRANGLQHDA